MNSAQLRKAIREMIKNQRDFDPVNVVLPKVHEFESEYQNCFNKEAKSLLKVRTKSLSHKWNEITDEKYHAHTLIDLLALLDISAAFENVYLTYYKHNISPVRFYGIECHGDEQLLEGISRIIDFINDVASNKWMLATLATGAVELQPLLDTDGDKRYVVYAYLAPDPKHEGLVQAKYSNLEFKEGSLPSEVIL